LFALAARDWHPPDHLRLGDTTGELMAQVGKGLPLSPLVIESSA
jgi:hypothetical protein